MMALTDLEVLEDLLLGLVEGQPDLVVEEHVGVVQLSAVVLRAGVRSLSC